MAEGRSYARRQPAQAESTQAKSKLREDLNRMIDDFLAKGGVITDCNGCQPRSRRGQSTPLIEDGLLPDPGAWD